MKTLDKVLIILAIFLFLFIVSIEVMFYICRDVPDSLIVGVLGCGGTECILTALITLGKKKWRIKDEDDF